MKAPNERIYQTDLGDKENRLAVAKGEGSGGGGVEGEAGGGRDGEGRDEKGRDEAEFVLIKMSLSAL